MNIDKNWKYFSAVGMYLGYPVGPDMESTVQEYYLSGQLPGFTAAVISQKKTTDDLDANLKQQFFKKSN